MDKLAALVKEKADEMPAGKEFCVRNVLAECWPITELFGEKKDWAEI